MAIFGFPMNVTNTHGVLLGADGGLTCVEQSSTFLTLLSFGLGAAPMKMLQKSLAALMLVAGGSTLIYAAPGTDKASTDKASTDKASTDKATADKAAAADSNAANADKKSADDGKGKKVEVWLTIAQLQTGAEELSVQASADLNHVNQLRLASQRGQDPIKLDCVNDKLLQMKGERNLLDGSTSSVGDAVALVNEESGNQAMKAARKIASKIHSLREAADACIGSNEVFYQGDTQVDWNGPETDDPDGNGFDPALEPPAYASPFS